MISSFNNQYPKINQKVWLDPSAVIIGDVTLEDDVSIWPTAVLRGDVNSIHIGKRSNIQDGTIIHVSHKTPLYAQGYPTIIGENVTIGHGVMLHACTIENTCLIGMRAIILDGAKVQKHSILAAGSLLPSNKIIPEGELWMGAPAKFNRTLSDKEIENIFYSAEHYVLLKDQYISEHQLV